MNQERLYRDYLHDILENAEKAMSFVAGMTEDEFVQDEKTVFAVIRAIEVIGEATKKIPNKIREKYPHGPWREMAGTCDKLIHAYFGVNSAVIWKTVSEDTPLLLPLLRQVLENETKA